MDKSGDDYEIQVDDETMVDDVLIPSEFDEIKTYKRGDDYEIQVDDEAMVDDVLIPSEFGEIVRDPSNDEIKMGYCWVDKNTNKNCFMLFVPALYIVNDEFCYWEREEQPLIRRKTHVIYTDIARLISVCWLEFGGSFDVSKLSPKTWYVVLFQVKLNKKVDEWTGWANVKLTLPVDMNTRVKHEHKVNMKAQEKGKWIEIPFGVFNTSVITEGEIKFSFIQTGSWISGIEVRGVKIQPLEDS